MTDTPVFDRRQSKKETVVDKRKKGSIWWRLHQLAGLQFSLFLSFVFITGTLSVISHEIDWALRPAMWVQPVAHYERVSWGTVLDSVQSYKSGIEIAGLGDPLHSASTFDVVVIDNGDRKHIYVHPKTGIVTGEGSWAGVQRFLRDAHRRIMIFDRVAGVRVGILIVCLTSVYLLVTLITSFWIYKKWWKGFFRWPKGKRLRSYVGDLHRWMGLWSLWFVVVMCYTGLWYLQGEFTTFERPQVEIFEANSDGGSVAEPSSSGAALDLGVSQILERYPSFDVESVSVSGLGTDNGTFRLDGQTDRAFLIDGYANAVWVDSNTGDLLRAQNPQNLSFPMRLNAMNNSLHFGVFAGYISKWIYFLFGALLSALSVTGVMVYALRLGKSERSTFGFKYFCKKVWLGMGVARWPAMALTLFSFFAAPFFM